MPQIAGKNVEANTGLETKEAKVCKEAFRTPELEWCKNGYNLGISSCNAICELHLSSIRLLSIFKISDNNFSVDCVDPVRSSKSVKQFHKSSLNGTYVSKCKVKNSLNFQKTNSVKSFSRNFS